MPPKPVACSCNKRFQTTDAMLQHQHDSQRHASAPQGPESLENLGQGRSLQTPEAGNSVRVLVEDLGAFTECTKLIPLPLGQSTAPPLAQHAPGQVLAGEKTRLISKKAKAKPIEKKSSKGSSVGTGQSGHASWEINPNTDDMMDMLQDQDWALCDKDCGWCGQCGDGAGYQAIPSSKLYLVQHGMEV